MEHENSDVADTAADPVAETLERLEVAQTLEDLRHHIDELIARLSSAADAPRPTAAADVAPELEGQIENLGNKVESASCLLAELADLLEAQAERIETIEQQLGEPELPLHTPPGAPANESEASAIPRFSMRPAQAVAERSASAEERAVDALDKVRLYVERRFDRLENAIQHVEHRLVDLRIEAEQRERQVRELEERLLILVEWSPARRDDDHVSEAPEPPKIARRELADEDVMMDDGENVRSAAGLAPRPAHMPLFAHDAVRVRRRLVRQVKTPAPPPASVLARTTGVRDSLGSSVQTDAAVQSPFVGDDPSLSRYVAQARSQPSEAGAGAVGRTAAPAVQEPRNGSGAALVTPVRANGSTEQRRAERDSAVNWTERDAAEAQPVSVTPVVEDARPVPDSVRELERLVERDVQLRREFRDGAVEGPRSWKAHPTVLVVDDAPDALTVLSIYLSKTGYNVVTASSAEDCLAKLRHHAVDVIVLDARLPGASGEHVCRVLRTDPAYAHRRDVPVIIYTGYSEEFPPEVRERWQADEYIVKGGDMLPLIRALVRHTYRDNRASL